MRSKGYASRGMLVVMVIAILLGGLFFAGIYLATDRGPGLLLPESPPEEEPDLTEVPDDDLRYAVILEKILAGPVLEGGEVLLDLSRRDDAVGYQASVALARRHREEGGDPLSLYLRALSLYDSSALRKELAIFLEEADRYPEAAEQLLKVLPDDLAIESLRRLIGPEALAKELVDLRLYEDAVREVEEASPGADWEELERPYLRALVGMGRYDEARAGLRDYYERTPSDSDMGWWLARSLEVAGHVSDALDLYTALGERGAYRRGIILEEQGFLEEAAAAFVFAPEPEARWRGGRLWEDLGYPTEALSVYMELGREPGVLQDDAAFRAYVLLSERDDQGAEEFAEYLRIHPAWMERLGEDAHWETVADDPGVASPRFLDRVEAYSASGREVLAQLELAIGRDRASSSDRLDLGEWYLEMEDFPAAVAQGSIVLQTHPTPRAYRLAYPLPFEDLVISAAADYDLDPYLLLAVMREESRYRSAVVSWAGARGLMQIMPSTGRDIAARKGVDFEVADLFDPEINIRFGAFYLRAMLDMFGGDLDRALAAYNAGPGNVQRWSGSSLASDELGFPVAITFVETREYITRVRNSYLTYLWLGGQ